ncbi:MAG: TetR family transcriptional regulator [Mollicutes bacterium]|nr:TetR family transcriptional regulator [Mollicutes bacterium]
MDRRSKYSINVIKESFLDLLVDNDFNSITITKICEKADVNRTTFYKYFIDIYDLLEKVQLDFINELKGTPKKEKYTVSSFADELLEVFIKNQKLVKILFETNNNIFFLEGVLDVAYNKCKEVWTLQNSSLNEQDIEDASVFIFNGALGIINAWVRNDFDRDYHEIAQIIESLSYYGIKPFIEKK